MKVMLILFVLFNLSFPLSFATLTNELDSGYRLEILREKDKNESNSSITGGGSEIVSERKFVHAGVGGGGGHSVGEGSKGNSGQANASPRVGGGAVIPVYAAGAAGRRNNHHSGSSINSRCGNDGLIIVSTILTSQLLHIFM